MSTTRSPRGWAGGFQAREVLLGLTSQPTYRGSGRNAARPLRSPLPWPPAHEGARFVIRSVGQLNRWVSGPPLARQRVQGEVDVLVCRVQVERGTDPTSANGRPYPSGREHYSKLPQPGRRKEMASIPWGKGIEAIVFHTIVDERRVITIHASRRALGGRPGSAAGATRRDGMSVSVSLSPPRPPGSRLRRPMLARPAVLGPRSRAPLSGNGRLMPGG